MNPLLTKLHQQGEVWRATQKKTHIPTIDSGYKLLNDKLLGGFPQQGVIEVQSLNGIGELRLLIPYLKNLLHHDSAKHGEQRQIVFIAPPAQVNALMFVQQHISLKRILVISSVNQSEALWAAEQCLKSGCCLAVFTWQQLLASHQVKRLKQAAATGQTIQVIFRSPYSIDIPLPVALSIGLTACRNGLMIEIKKQQGGWPQLPFLLDMAQQWPELTQLPLANNVVPLSTAKVG